MHVKGKRVFGVALLLLCMLCSTAFALAVEAEVVKSVNMREGAGTEFEKMDKLRKGTVVTVLERAADQEWWKVSYKEKEGYISKEYLKIKYPEAQAGYAARNTQLRAEANSKAEALTAVPIRAEVNVLDSTDKSWWWVMYDNKEGYVQASAMKLGELPASGSSQGGSSQGGRPAAGSSAVDMAGGAASSDAGTGAGSDAVSANDKNASKIARAKGINSDTVGWINVPRTNIDDPILYGPNFYYNNRNINKSKSLEGVYPYVNRLTKNVVIFGHNLRGSNRGFHQMHHLQEAANGRSKCQYGKCGRAIGSLSNWYKSAEGRTWNISIFGKTKWEVFAMYEVPRNEPIATLRSNWATNPTNMSGWIERQLKRSEIDFGVSVSDKDSIMTIITCGTNYDSATANSRLFVFLKNVG